MNKKLLAKILVVIIFLAFSEYLMPIILNYISMPFQNTEGKFDLSIFWTAIAGLGTVILGIVAFMQNRNYRVRDEIMQNKVMLLKNGEIREDGISTFRNTYTTLPNYIKNCNVFLIKKEDTKWKILSVRLKFLTGNGVIPDEFKIEKISVRYENKNILNNNMIYQNRSAEITEFDRTGFFCFVDIADDGLSKYMDKVFEISMEITFIKRMISHNVESRYDYICQVDLQNKESEFEYWVKPAMFKDLLLKNIVDQRVKK